MTRSYNIYLCSCTIALEMITPAHGKLYPMYERMIIISKFMRASYKQVQIIMCICLEIIYRIPGPANV